MRRKSQTNQSAPRNKRSMKLQLEDIAKLRIAVGYLGERERLGWWQSSFFTDWSKSFLSPIFSRTQLLAQYAGVIQAAALIHDERIGIGRVYHLFRLPEVVEQGLRQMVLRPEFGDEIAAHISGQESVQSFLNLQAAEVEMTATGPVYIGQVGDIYGEQAWRAVAAHYARGFEQNYQVFPYFRE